MKEMKEMKDERNEKMISRMFKYISEFNGYIYKKIIRNFSYSESDNKKLLCWAEEVRDFCVDELEERKKSEEKSLVFAQQSAKQLGKPLGWFIRKKDEYDLEFEKLMNSYIKLYSEYHKELILEKVEELQCKINTASSRGIRKIYHKQKQDLLKQIENL